MHAVIVRNLAADSDAFIRSTDFQQRWAELNFTRLGVTPEVGVNHNQVETTNWSAMITAGNIRVD